jgi:hypothetical protein
MVFDSDHRHRQSAYRLPFPLFEVLVGKAFKTVLALKLNPLDQLGLAIKSLNMGKE